jgi:hypothetical protein
VKRVGELGLLEPLPRLRAAYSTLFQLRSYLVVGGGIRWVGGSERCGYVGSSQAVGNDRRLLNWLSKGREARRSQELSPKSTRVVHWYIRRRQWTLKTLSFARVCFSHPTLLPLARTKPSHLPYGLHTTSRHSTKQSSSQTTVAANEERARRIGKWLLWRTGSRNFRLVGRIRSALHSSSAV